LRPAAPCQLTDPDDLNVEAVQLLQKLEQVSCDGPLDAAADLARALALGSPADGVGAGGRVITSLPRAAMSPAASGGRTVEPVTEEDF
jgi:hypothetical protein